MLGIEDQAFEPTMIGCTPRFHRPSFMEIKYLDPEKKIFEGCFIHGCSGWSFDSDYMNKHLFPLYMEAPHKIWLLSQSV